MVPVRVEGIGVGCSGHISPAGYVASTPYVDRGASAVLVVAWLDAEQLAAVDATAFPDHRRAILPGDEFPMTMPSGERLGGAYIYFSSHGVPAGPDGTPRPGAGDQSELLAALLAASPRLGELLGPDPSSWVKKADIDPALREEGTRRPTSCRTSTLPSTCGFTTTCRLSATRSAERLGRNRQGLDILLTLTGGVRPDGLGPDDR